LAKREKEQSSDLPAARYGTYVPGRKEKRDGWPGIGRTLSEEREREKFSGERLDATRMAEYSA